MITVYSGRGILSESQGPVWMIGTACALTFLILPPNMLKRRIHSERAAEHHVIYQYNLARAKNHYMGLIQTESVCFSVIACLIVFTWKSIHWNFIAVFPTQTCCSDTV